MQKDRTETAELLLKLGADVNARNWRGQTPGARQGLYVVFDEQKSQDQ